MASSKPLKVFQFNVGAGDHMLLELPNGEYGIIDFHYSSQLNLCKPPAVYYLRHLIRANKGKKVVIAFLCLSHYDLDHLRGIQSFMKLVSRHSIEIKRIWLGGEKEMFSWMLEKIGNFWRKKGQPARVNESELSELEDNIEAVSRSLNKIKSFLKKQKNNSPVYLKAFDQLSNALGGHYKAMAFGPLDEHIIAFQSMAVDNVANVLFYKDKRRGPYDRNLISSILYLFNEHFQLAFGGDAHDSVWRRCLEEYRKRNFSNLCVDFIKVGHHGSKHSSSPALWETLIEGKSIVYFSISAGKKYSHPSSQTIRDIQAACKNKGVMPVILTTNVCTGCKLEASLPDIKDINLDPANWGLEKGRKYLKDNPNVRNAFNLSSPREYRDWQGSNPGAGKAMGLVAYVLEFDPNSKKIKAHIKRSPQIPPNSQCVFRKYKYKPKACEEV